MPPRLPSATAEPAITAGKNRRAFAALCLAMLLPSLGTSSANVALPTLAQAFDASFQAVQWIVLAYLLAITTLIVGAGRLGDLIGRRRLLLAGLALFTLASILCGLAPTLWLLIAARAAQGAGAATMMALALAFVGETVARERIGRAMGLLGTMSATGTALGPSLGGLLIAGFGWHAIFLINVPFGLVALLLARHLPAGHLAAGRADRQASGFDGTGTFVLAVALAAYALAMTLTMTWVRGYFGAPNLALLLAAAGATALFIRVEAKAASPLLRPALFRDPALRASLTTSLLVSTVIMATFVVGPFYLSRALGLDAVHVGLVLSIGTLVAALAGVPAGRLVDRFGAGSMVIAGLAILAAGCAFLALLPVRLGVPGYGACVALSTLGYALFQAANNTAVMTDVGPDRRGLVSGMLNLSRNLGLVTGASLMGAVFACAAATADLTAASPAAVATGLHATFTLAAILILAALALAAFAIAGARSAPVIAPASKMGSKDGPAKARAQPGE